IFIFKKKKLIIPYLIIGLYFILYILGIILYKDNNNLFFEIQNLVKVFYFPIVFLSLYSIKDKVNIENKILIKTLFKYLILILIPTIFGIGYKTYEITKEGTLGFFNSANEISGIISILTPVIFIMFKDKKNILLSILLGIVYLVVILMMGTKTPLLALCFTIGVFLAYLVIESIKKKQYKKIIITISVLIVGVFGLILVLPKTNFYKNIKTHLDFLEVEHITDVFKKKELIDHFIFSQRLTFLEKEHKLYKESNLYLKVFGIGYLDNGEETKMVEMDYFDIFYHHGIVGFLLYFSIIIYLLVKKIRFTKSFEGIMLKTSFLLIIILSFFTGHIITAPAVSIIVIAILLKIMNHKKSMV
ncbi:MAG: O-antigen ligase family protein, partial [Bacilli bacterium]|nr:O-antigen ligase family protein [Bacilli bacterium]